MRLLGIKKQKVFSHQQCKIAQANLVHNGISIKIKQNLYTHSPYTPF